MSIGLRQIELHIDEAREEVYRCIDLCAGLEESCPTKLEIAWLCKYWNLIKEIEDALNTLDKSLKDVIITG